MSESSVVALQMTASQVHHWHGGDPKVRFIYLNDYEALKTKYFELKRLAEEMRDEVKSLQKQVDDFNAHLFGREE